MTKENNLQAANSSSAVNSYPQRFLWLVLYLNLIEQAWLEQCIDDKAKHKKDEINKNRYVGDQNGGQQMDDSFLDLRNPKHKK